MYVFRVFSIPNHRISLLQAACLILMTLPFMGSQPATGGQQGNDLARLVYDLKHKKKLYWKLHHKYDPYQQGTILRSYHPYAEKLILRADQSFASYDQDSKKEGKWELQKSQQGISFLTQRVNGRTLRADYRRTVTYQVKSYSRSQLVLSWQGRHGMVDMVYVPAFERSMVQFF